MRVKSVTQRGLLSKGKPIAVGEPSDGHFVTRADGRSDSHYRIATATAFFKDKETDKEVALTLSQSDLTLFEKLFRGEQVE